MTVRARKAPTMQGIATASGVLLQLVMIQIQLDIIATRGSVQVGASIEYSPVPA